MTGRTRTKTAKSPRSEPTVLIRTDVDFAEFKRRVNLGIRHGGYTPNQRFLAFKFAQRSVLSIDGCFISPHRPGRKPVFSYRAGAALAVPHANTRASLDCGAGVHVASLDWIKRGFAGYTGAIFLVEFTRRNIAVVPYAGNGKFRLKRGRIVLKVADVTVSVTGQMVLDPFIS